MKGRTRRKHRAGDDAATRSLVPNDPPDRPRDNIAQAAAMTILPILDTLIPFLIWWEARRLDGSQNLGLDKVGDDLGTGGLERTRR
jgi:hypothetical protein